MSLTNLAAVSTVASMLRSNSIIVEVGGAVRRITLDKLMDAINSEQEGILRQSDSNNQGICDAAWYSILREDYLAHK